MAVEPQASAKRRQMIGLFLGLLVAGGSGIGLYLVVSKNQTNAPPQATTVGVVVALTPVAKGTKLTEANVQVVQRPVDELPVQSAAPSPGALPTYFSDITQVLPDRYFAAVDLTQNEVITPNLVVGNLAQINNQVITQPPLDIKDGDVAMAIPIDDQKGVGGWIQTGDHIDIIADVNGNGSIRYALQDVPILRIGSAGQIPAAAAAGQATITTTLIVVELTRREAEFVSFIINNKGTPTSVVRYVLRPKTQYGTGPQNHKLLTSVDPTGGQQAPPETPVSPATWTTLFPPG